MENLDALISVAKGAHLQKEIDGSLVVGQGGHNYPLSYKDGSPPRILDLGCGTGKWCMDMAE